MNNEESFVVVSGKYEQDEMGMSRNYKFISEPFQYLSDAMPDYIKNIGYHFNEIEFTDKDGKIWTLTVEERDNHIRNQYKPEEGMSINGTTTGRISAKTVAVSNTPKSGSSNKEESEYD